MTEKSLSYQEMIVLANNAKHWTRQCGAKNSDLGAFVTAVNAKVRLSISADVKNDKLHYEIYAINRDVPDMPISEHCAGSEHIYQDLVLLYEKVHRIVEPMFYEREELLRDIRKLLPTE